MSEVPQYEIKLSQICQKAPLETLEVFFKCD